ncbi:hypothetical protein DQ239_12380 [Blastococcus sp. TF02-09]|uniref:hypothetical protein n=1 Tax=Blastococcus sp. TF02-09 TaxID=2250576 RepID=UPI000DEAC2D8|nr:hypothetical protein [Blastococcus sp. TF02-9]RBY76971.1 hypothetical protein DQ239_12380 [Blastococcus sp. TF02-9]
MTATDTTPSAGSALPDSPSRGRRAWPWAAAVSAAAAGGLHMRAAFDHVGAHDVVVGFFLVVAFAQLALGVWLAMGVVAGLRPDVRLIGLALLATVALVGLYVVAHTTDLLAAFQVHDTAAHHGAGTVGTEAHSTETTGPVALGLEPVTTREPATLLGAGTVALEMVTVLSLTALLPARWRGGAANALLLLGAATWLLWLTGVLA